MENVERGDWKKRAAKGTQYNSSVPLLRSNSIFFKLPPEVRLMIYSDLIKSGALEVLRLCQRIHREALEILYRDGIHRVITYSNRAYRMAVREGPQVNQINRISDKVQNVEIYTRLDTYLQCGYEEVEYLEAFHPDLTNTAIRRKNCWFHLTINDTPNGNRFTNSRLIMALRLVQHFDNVFLNVRPPTPLTESASWFKAIGKRMEPWFGPSIWRDSPDPMKRYWIFHPREKVHELEAYYGA